MALNPGRIQPVSNLGFAAAGRSINKFGHSPSTGTVQMTCWPGTGLVSYLSAGTVMTVSSSATADTSTGTGARTVVVYGLDDNYAEVSGTVSLSGTAGTATSQSFLRVTRVMVTSAGSGGVNAGTVYAGTGALTAGVPAGDKFAVIIPSDNQTLQAFTTVPAGVTAYVTSMQCYVEKAVDGEFELYVRPFGQVFQLKLHAHSYETPFAHTWDPPLKIAAKSDIEVRVKSDGPTKDLSATFDMILV